MTESALCDLFVISDVDGAVALHDAGTYASDSVVRWVKFYALPL